MSKTNAIFWGHSRNGGGSGVPESVGLHVRRVRELATAFATPLGIRIAAQACADLHDLGKYSPKFNGYVQGMPGFTSPDHWSAGARLALALILGGTNSETTIRDAIRLVIESHHSALTSLESTEESISRLDNVLRNTQRPICEDISKFVLHWREDGFDHNRRTAEKLSTSIAGAMLDVRMLFSCLVDADFLATEAHFNGNSIKTYRPRSPAPIIDFAFAANHVECFVNALSQSASKVQSVRDELRRCCIDAAELTSGVFTLTAPTGSGKTLSMLQFAMRHAAKNNLRRIIIVMPFLTIVDQTVSVIRECLQQLPSYDDRWILEDHSLAESQSTDESTQDTNDPETEEWNRTRRLMAENWDAPIVLTSSVKCLESLHSNRISACRKLHRMGNSVVLFDEVQTLPPRLAVLTLSTLSHLANRFQSSVVFSTATQPAFELLDKEVSSPLPQAWRVRDLSTPGWSPSEIVTDCDAMFAVTAHRVSVVWDEQTETPLSKIASRVRKSPTSALVIVNLKRHATELFHLIDRGGGDTFHLSTSMCSLHRVQTLDRIRPLVKADHPIRLVSTQCIEAGVDISFGSGWRAYAPLDSIAQAAGRVNRSGERNTPSSLVVFKPDVPGSLYPPGYQQGVAALDALLAQLRSEGIDPNDVNIISSPQMIRRYYALLYSLSDNTIMAEELREGLEGLDFESVAKHYRLIPGSQINVLVPYVRSSFEELIERFESTDRSPGWASAWFRDARPHAVSIYRQDFDALASYLAPLPFGADQNRDPDTAMWWYLLDSGSQYYDANTGLCPPEDGETLIT